MIGFTLRATNDRVSTGLRNLQSGLQNPRPMYKQLGLAGVRWVLKNFQREGQPRWQNLKPATATARIRPGSPRRRGSSHILVSNGLYRASFAYQESNHSVRIGSPWKIAMVHEEGSRQRGIPKRQVLPTQRQSEEFVVPISKKYVKDIIKESNLD